MQRAKIVLIQNWFNSKERHDEYITCLRKNDKNKYIDRILLLCNDLHSDLDGLSDKVERILVGYVPTYMQFFQLANALCKDDIIVLSNLDMYFNDTLRFVHKYIGDNKILALSRWDVQSDGTLNLWECARGSQDTWIFKSPINTSDMLADFTLGIGACDNRIAYELSLHHRVINPCMKIITEHLHLINYRKWISGDTILESIPITTRYKEVPVGGFECVSFSLFSCKRDMEHRSWDAHKADDRYWYNIPALVAVYKTLYPSFIIKFHVSKDLTGTKIFELLTEMDKQCLIKLQVMVDTYSNTEPTLWRYMPVFDPIVESVLVRDIDSLPTSGELAANNYFINSESNVCTIRSNSAHNIAGTMMMAGLSSFKPARLNHTMDFSNFYKKYATPVWGCDQGAVIDYFLIQSKHEASEFIDFSICSETQTVESPLNNRCIALRNPKLEKHSLFYTKHEKLLNILDSVSQWAGEPVDARGDILRDILDTTGSVGRNIEKIIQKTGNIDFFKLNNKYPNIHLLCSTIRPETFKTTHQAWINAASNKDIIKTKVVVDSSVMANQLSEFDVVIYDKPNVGITKPLTHLTASLTGLDDEDIIVVMSDDFFPPNNWDTFLLEQFTGFDGALRVNDGVCETTKNLIISIPILTYSCLKKLNGVVYHPAYTHLYSDNELYDNLVELNLLKTITPNQGYVFEHRHWTLGKRKHDAADAGVTQRIQEDSATYTRRKNMPLEERLKV
jgi:hypothetical protein